MCHLEDQTWDETPSSVLACTETPQCTYLNIFKGGGGTRDKQGKEQKCSDKRVLASWGCWNKVPQTVAFTQQTCIALQLGRLKVQDQGILRGGCLLKVVDNLPHVSHLASRGALAIFGIPRLKNASLQSLPSCAYGILCVCLSLRTDVNPFWKDTEHWIRANPKDLILTPYLQRPYFQVG